jgi:hypothetical protein
MIIDKGKKRWQIFFFLMTYFAVPRRGITHNLQSR